ADPESARKHYTTDPKLDTNDWRSIEAPKAWEGAGLADFDGLVWFRTVVDLPATLAGKPISLALGQVRDTDITWFNGTLVGCNQMKGNFRNYQIDGALVKPGKNLLTVAILNTSGPGGFVGDPRNMIIRQADDQKGVPINGTWQAKPG